MEIKNVAILANNKAGKGKSKKIAIWLQDQLLARNKQCNIYELHWPSNNELAQYSDVWIIGGDGTMNYFINKYPDCKIPIALFSGGTGNDFAWKLYGNVKIEQQLKNILNAKPQPIDAAKVNDKLYINCLGVGFD